MGKLGDREAMVRHGLGDKELMGANEASEPQRDAPLRVGLLLDSTIKPIWVYRMLERIRCSSYAQVVLLVLDERASRPEPLPVKLANWRTLPGWALSRVLGRLYNAFDRRRSGYVDAFVPCDIGPLVAGAPRLTIHPVVNKHFDSFMDADLEAIADHNVDVFIRLGFRILRGGILKLAPHGVWSLHHGDNTVSRGGPAGFWEVCLGWPETGCILQILNEDLDNGTVLARTISCTDRTSYLRNRCRLYWKSLALIPRKLEELHRDGAEAFYVRAAALNRDPVVYSNRLFMRPTNLELLRFITSSCWVQLGNIVRSRLVFDQWVLLISPRHALSTSLWRFRKIVPPPDRFWADPHVMSRDGRFYVFCEEYLYSQGRGRIACMEIDRKGRWEPPYVVLERDYHLSYPFIFEHDARLYMIPETAERETIELYACDQFPRHWHFEQELMSGLKAWDTTLHRYGGRWWLFANMVENDGASSWDELFVFWADSPLSTHWTPHPRNPVVSDASRARPAGRLFERDGRVYRPSQKCTPNYGYGFNLNEIEVLDEREYRERLVTTALPRWARNVRGTHSLSHVPGMTVSDALLRRWRLW